MEMIRFDAHDIENTLSEMNELQIDRPAFGAIRPEHTGETGNLGLTLFFLKTVQGSCK